MTEAPKSPWYKKVLFIIVLVLLSPILITIIIILALPWLFSRFIQRPRLLRRIKNEWLPQNKFILFIYSDNQDWKNYAEQNIIPKIKEHSIILNWSERNNWINSNTLEAKIFKNFHWGREWIWRQNIRAGGQNYNHQAIIFKPWNKPKIINFWKPFKDHQFGNETNLKNTETELYNYCK